MNEQGEPGMADAPGRETTDSGERAFERLTGRQKQCLRLVGQGYTSKEIARQLAISPATVDNHIRGALDQLRLPARAEAARALLAWETGQSLTSQPPAVAGDAMPVPARLRDGDLPLAGWRRLVPPLGGVRNDLTPADRHAAILQIALFSLIVLALMTLIAAMLLWAMR